MDIDDVRDLWKVWIVRKDNISYKVFLYSNTTYNYYIPFYYKQKSVIIIK